MKINGHETVEKEDDRFEGLRLWYGEMRLRFDLRYSKYFKGFCEERGFPNLASLEAGYIDKVKSEIAEIQERRTAWKRKNHSRNAVNQIQPLT